MSRITATDEYSLFSFRPQVYHIDLNEVTEKSQFFISY